MNTIESCDNKNWRRISGQLVQWLSQSDYSRTFQDTILIFEGPNPLKKYYKNLTLDVSVILANFVQMQVCFGP